MSLFYLDSSQNGSKKSNENMFTVAEGEECVFSKKSEKLRFLTLDKERKRSFDERSFNELSAGYSSPRLSYRADNSSSVRLSDNVETMLLSPGRKSGINTPRSHISFDPHSLTVEAWEALRRSLVYFRGQPVGTIAALDNSEEDLNYDQVLSCTNILVHRILE